jgi:hypothetical protein
MRPIRTWLAAFTLALSGPAPAAAGDFDTLRVAAAVPLPGLMAGPGNTALLLSPDGGHLLHLTKRDGGNCLYTLAGGAPQRLRCMPTEATADGVDGAVWSPDAARLTWPNQRRALIRLRDADVEVLDLATMALRRLTEDGFDGGLLESPAPLDLAAGWQDADTVLFVRVTRPAGGAEGPAPASLHAVASDGVARELLPALGAGGWPVAAAVAADGATVAAYVDDRKRPEAGGLYLHRIGEAAATLLVPATAFAASPSALAFSADGSLLLAAGYRADGIAAALVEVATGRSVPLFPHERADAVGWSPTGSALVYVVPEDQATGAGGGLYLSEPPGAPGRLLRAGRFTAPHCCTQLLTWARNDTILLGNRADFDAPVLLRLVR